MCWCWMRQGCATKTRVLHIQFGFYQQSVIGIVDALYYMLPCQSVQLPALPSSSIHIFGVICVFPNDRAKKITAMDITMTINATKTTF